jgi:N-acetylmuramoyl-L-alanine amidase
LPLAIELDGDWAAVSFGGQPFRFLLDAGLFVHAGQMIPLTGGAYLGGDTVFLPLQWLTDYIPRVFPEGFRYDPLAARFEEAGLARTSGPLRMPHKVVVDAGHGGEDPGTPGLHFPSGIREKDVTLALAKLLQVELQRRGITVLMTRKTDLRIDYADRAGLCARDCDLFLSLHVNSLPRRGGYQSIGGFETYFLGQAGTAEARRAAATENDALRYETSYVPGSQNDPFGFILKDLQTNEYLRESAALAETIQSHGSRVHPGGSRGVAQHDRFIVLRLATRPAVLVETGFSTNREDGRFLASAAGQQKLARAIADGVIDYLVQYERKIAAGVER